VTLLARCLAMLIQSRTLKKTKARSAAAKYDGLGGSFAQNTRRNRRIDAE